MSIRMSLVIFGSLPQNLLHVSIAKLFQQLPVKKRAMKATSSITYVSMLIKRQISNRKNYRNPIENSKKVTKSIPLTHEYMTVYFPDLILQ
jgi:hypothetical protein